MKKRVLTQIQTPRLPLRVSSKGLCKHAVQFHLREEAVALEDVTIKSALVIDFPEVYDHVVGFRDCSV